LEFRTRLLKGVESWNKWRASTAIIPNLKGTSLDNLDLRSADLSDANLTYATLVNTDLSRSQLNHAVLSYATLTRATLSHCELAYASFNAASAANADLSHVNGVFAAFSGALLTGSDCSYADWTFTYFRRCDLTDANFTGSKMFATVFAGVDLSKTKGLESIEHRGRSYVDIETLVRSKGQIPAVFLRGVGVPDSIIRNTKSLFVEAGPIHFSSVFISYSTANQDFAERLHADLQDEGVRCWFAPHNIQGGKKVHEQIEEAIRLYDRLLLVLSRDSMNSAWVQTEIANARAKESAMKRRVLFPLSLVPFAEVRSWKQFDADRGDDTAKEIREYYIPDFTDWKNHDVYRREFARLLDALTE
jgi:hypothetical protein